MRTRDARVEDAAAIEALLRLLDHAAAPVEARLASPLPGDVVLVAERERVVGVAAAATFHAFEYPRPQLRVSAIAVAPTARRSGVGRALVRALEARASALGCFRVELTSAHHLEPAHASWRALGYRDAGRRFVRGV